LELRGTAAGVAVFDDFAHHPTAIAATLAGVRARHGAGRVVAVLEPRSNTLRMGVFKDELAGSLAAADAAILYQPPDLGWTLDAVAAALDGRGRVCATIDAAVAAAVAAVQPGDCVVVMSNGGFGGIHGRILDALAARADGSVG
ncbi:MAG: UDP-N-acetylmuramate:L-alanyl-gamma-D-glutamyl-meso-diaminopimelate ligase, partial [Pseudomonadota bacterium]|nr:UDP-N-acetylmuramate:L-alanyl-gamma-D-glutamyl-meso-diaminopimelate ligase [Pseudomonadota bacterium]